MKIDMLEMTPVAKKLPIYVVGESLWLTHPAWYSGPVTIVKPFHGKQAKFYNHKTEKHVIDAYYLVKLPVNIEGAGNASESDELYVAEFMLSRI